jgi:hypothetical protein
MPSLPTTTIAGISLPKILIGTNSLLGWSHTSSGRDEWIRKTYTAERVAEVLVHCASQGATAVLGPLLPRLTDAIAIARGTDPRITWVSTTIGTSKETFREQIAEIKDIGSPICFLHGGWTDRWPVVDGRLDGLERYIDEIREAGMIPGTAVHNGERLAMVTRLGYDFDAYLVPVNQAGFAMRPDRATMLAAVAGAGKPVIAIKPLACGRFDENKPGDWMRWTLDQAGVVATAVGVMSEEEASEDLAAAREILAALVGV